jgi:peroxiredoxin
MHRWSGTWVTVVLLLLVLSTGVNVAQAQRIRTLVSQSGARSLLVGKRVRAAEAFSLDGKRVELSFDRGLPTVLYYFSSTCAWCQRNWANVTALSEASGDRYRVVAVSAERNLRPFVAKKGLRLEVLEQLSEETVLALGLGGTPITIVIGADGVVTHEWRGAYSERIGRQIEDLFGVTLPGLLLAPAEASPRGEGFRK